MANDKLETYLEEISHYLSGRAEREEILNEIRSHILEKAASGGGGSLSDEAIAQAIAALGPARRLAERYAEDRPIIAPAYKRYLFRYTTLLFAIHTVLIILAVIFRESFIIFPILFVPRVSPFDAILYLPMAFLADLGLVALVLYFITQSGKDIALPWPKFGLDLDEVKPPRRHFWNIFGTAVRATIMLAITSFCLHLLARYDTIFVYLTRAKEPKLIFTPAAGHYLSILVIILIAVSTVALVTKLFTESRWVDIVSNAISLAIIGLVLRQPFDNLFAINIPDKLLSWLKPTILITLLIIALVTAYQLIRDIIRVSRHHLRGT
jgi:hypothetical protein